MANRPGGEASGEEKLGLAGVGIAVLAIACCAGVPLIAGVAGGIAVAAVLGVGAGVLALAALVALGVAAGRRRRACERPGQEHSIGPRDREAPSSRLEQPIGSDR
jgi:hypothetical protein